MKPVFKIFQKKSLSSRKSRQIYLKTVADPVAYYDIYKLDKGQNVLMHLSLWAVKSNKYSLYFYKLF